MCTRWWKLPEIAECAVHAVLPMVTQRKLDLLVKELARYRISIAGIQEMKWFGSDIWPSGEWTFLHSGRVLPADDDIAIRREGVGILLDGRATATWRAVGGDAICGQLCPHV